MTTKRWRGVSGRKPSAAASALRARGAEQADGQRLARAARKAGTKSVPLRLAGNGAAIEQLAAMSTPTPSGRMRKSSSAAANSGSRAHHVGVVGVHEADLGEAPLLDQPRHQGDRLVPARGWRPGTPRIGHRCRHAWRAARDGCACSCRHPPRDVRPSCSQAALDGAVERRALRSDGRRGRRRRAAARRRDAPWRRRRRPDRRRRRSCPACGRCRAARSIVATDGRPSSKVSIVLSWTPVPPG